MSLVFILETEPHDEEDFKRIMRKVTVVIQELRDDGVYMASLSIHKDDNAAQVMECSRALI